jgi:chemotaxis protein CheY-P-specific phosphatase CheC
MTAAQVAADVTAAQAIGNTILDTVSAVDPAADVPAAEAGAILNLTGQLVSAALTAWSNASGTPITAETVAALLPNATPLPEPS